MKIEDLSGDYCTLATDEDSFEVEICDTVEYENKTYVFMLPVDEPETEEIYIMQETQQGDGTEYYPVEDNTELNILFEIFKKRNKGQFIFDN